MTCQPLQLISALAVGALLSATAQTVPGVGVPDGALVIAGDVSKPLTLTTADLQSMPRMTVLVEQQGGQARYEGVLAGEILKRAGARLGRDLSGKAYVRASAKDGYAVVFSLAELDQEFTPNDIIIADTLDGKPLPATQGPLRLIAPRDKHGSRFVRMLQRLEVVQLVK